MGIQFKSLCNQWFVVVFWGFGESGWRSDQSSGIMLPLPMGENKAGSVSAVPLRLWMRGTRSARRDSGLVQTAFWEVDRATKWT